MDVLLLALEAAIYPTLLAAVVILLSQPRPGRLLAAYLAGGLTISITLGVLIVAALNDSHAIGGERSGPSWGADLTVGGLALLLAVLLATRADERVRRRRAARKPPSTKEPWSERLLARGSVPIVFGAALAINVPGAAYLIALKDIAAGNHSPEAEVALILAFNVIMFAMAELPLLGLRFAPERTNELVRRTNAWLSRHGRELATGLCGILGAYLIVRGIAHAS
jgi:MFS family permease